MRWPARRHRLFTVVESRLYEEHGLPFGPEDKAALIGNTIGRVAEIMAARFGGAGSGDIRSRLEGESAP